MQHFKFIAALAIAILTASVAHAQFTGNLPGGSVYGNTGTSSSPGTPSRDPVFGIPGSVAGSATFAATGGGSVKIKADPAATGAANLTIGLGNANRAFTLGGDLTTIGNFATTITSTATTNATLPAGTHTLAAPDVAQTWSALQQYNDGDFALKGSISGTLTMKAAATSGSDSITWPAGSTDFSATGGTSNFVKQSSLGGTLTVGTIGTADLPDGTSGYALIGNGGSLGPSFKGFLNPATGGTTRPFISSTIGKLNDIQGVLDFANIDNAGSADSTAGFTAFNAAQRATHITAGTYKLSSQPTLSDKAVMLMGSNTSFTGSGSPYGYNTTVTLSAGASVSDTSLTVTSTSGVQNGMLASNQNVIGTDGTGTPANCLANNTTVTVTDSTHLALSVAVVCAIASGTTINLQIVSPTMRRGPYFFEFDSIANASDYSDLHNDAHMTTPLIVQQVVNRSGGTGTTDAGMTLREVINGNMGVQYAYVDYVEGQQGFYGTQGGFNINIIKKGDGHVAAWTPTITMQSPGTQGLQSAELMQGTIGCASSGIYCAQRLSEIIQSDNGTPSHLTGFLVRQNITSTVTGIEKSAFIAQNSSTGGAAPGRGILEAAGYAADRWLYGVNFAQPQGAAGAGTSHFVTGSFTSVPTWARVFNGDTLVSVTGGVGGLVSPLQLVADSAGSGCTGGPGPVALTVSGGTGSGGGAASAILSNTGSVVIAYVTTPGSYITPPTISLSGCSVAPVFHTPLLQLDRPVLGTDSSGVTQLWGADVGAALAPHGTIEFMNASTSNPMMFMRGDTGGGVQIYNGASAPTGTDLGAGTLNAAGKIQSNVGYAGLTGGSVPAAGLIGETKTLSIGAGSSVAFGGTGNTAVVGNVALTAGNWIVCGSFGVTDAGTPTYTSIQASINTTNGTILAATSPLIYTWKGSLNLTGQPLTRSLACQSVPISGSTTYYLNVKASYTGGTAPAAFGSITAWRLG